MRKNLIVNCYVIIYGITIDRVWGNISKEPQQSGNNAQGGTESDVFRVGWNAAILLSTGPAG